MHFQAVKNVYFIGIGGIGMSAIARWFLANGKFVAGYDRTPTALTDALTAQQIPIIYQSECSALPPQISQSSPSDTLIVYTPAVPKDHAQLVWFAQNGYTIYKRSQVLGMLTQAGGKTLAVAGTHGKTTTSCMLAHILHEAGVACGAFLGGISNNLQSNFLLSPKPAAESVWVVEADEFDRSFLALFADLAIITSTDADHLDIYGHHQELLLAFQLFASQLKPGGIRIIHEKVAGQFEAIESLRSYTYGRSPESDFYISNIIANGLCFEFDLRLPDEQNLVGLSLAQPGFHNVENATAALAAAYFQGVEPQDFRALLASYTGVKRRFDIVAQNKDLVLIDDYAHHPAEISAFITSTRALFAGQPITVIFQPHLFSRTQDFYQEFADSLSLADTIVLLNIYPARELPIEGVSSELILEHIKNKNKIIVSITNIIDYIGKNKPNGVLAMLGAGDIDTLRTPLEVLLFDSADILDLQTDY